ncbi:MAG: hypothetical protein U0T74_02040 [Chitinophagales bacterium]
MKKISLQHFSELVSTGHLVVDTRKPEVFCDGFIVESISIPFSESFIDAFQELVEDSQPVLIIADEEQIDQLSKIFRLHTQDNVGGYLEGGYEAWREAGKKIDMLIGVEADEFAIDYNFDEFYLVDVRTAEEYQAEHVEDAENIALIDLERVLIDLDEPGNYYVYGNTIPETTTAGSIFKRNGFDRVRIVLSDYTSLRESGVSFYKPKKSKTDTKFSDN